MNSCYYKKAVDKCPMIYISGKVIRNQKNYIIDYIVEDTNKSFFYNIYECNKYEVLNKSLDKVLGISNSDFDRFKEEKLDEFTIYQYVPKFKDIYKITMQIEGNSFFLWMERYILKDNYMEAIRNNLKSVIWTKDINGRYIRVNNRFEELVGLGEKEIIGKTNYDIKTPKTLSYINTYEEALLNGEAKKIERIIFENNEWINVAIYPILDEHNNIIGTVGFKLYDDIDSKSTMLWRDKNKMLEIIVDNLPIPIFYKDTNGTYLYCNEPFEDLLELDRDKIIGKKDSDLENNKELISIYRKADEKVIKNKESIVDEVVLNRSKDSVCVEINKVPLWDYRKEVIGIIGMVLDVTERKATEKELEKLRMDFFSNLSHEFRTPLNLIFASVQLIDKNIPKIELGDINTLIRYLNIIDQNGMRLLKLVNNLIDSTRIDSGCLDYNPENQNIIEFVENICDSVIEFSKLQNIELIFDTDEEEKIVAFDSDKIERILLNLLSNAIKYNKHYGNIYVCINCKGDYVDIIVKDTGVGIPEDKLEDVFEKFKQVDNRLTKISEGSGIGLSIVKSLVDLHNGRIEVKSELGKGTEFKIKIPNKIIELDKNINIIKNESINIDKKIQIEFSDIYC